MSMLFHFFDKVLDARVRKLKICSDNCSAQNKSNALIQFLFTMVESGRFDEIVHHFPEPGHSYLPCDRRFGIVSKEKRKMEFLYVPEDYHKVVEESCANNVVVKVDQSIFKNYEEVLTDHYLLPRQYKGRFNNGDRAKWSISKYRVFKYERDVTNGTTLKVSENHSLVPSYATFHIQKSAFNRAIFQNLSQLYTGPIPISEAKYRDVMKLVNAYVPPEHRTFYDKLTYKTERLHTNPSLESFDEDSETSEMEEDA